MGVKKSCTCAPYEAGLVPKRGTHIAWSESSAVSFANSVLGAMTNREGGPSALSASLIGKTPNYGYHLVENRLGEIKFKVNFDLNDLDFSLLGYHIGKIAQNRIPVIEGIKKANREQLKSLGAGAAASGGVGMFMVKHITSEYRERDNIEVLNVHQSDLENIVNQFANCSSYDVIAFGCPHSSFKEIKQIIDNVKTTKEIWICTAREIKERALKELKLIPKNIKILADTCMVVAPVKEIGIECIATNSTKCAHYSQNLSRIKTLLKSKEDLLNET
jgi:hypothetical protein